MNAADLYQAIGAVKTEYLEESERSTEKYGVRGSLRALLIAAVIAVLCGVTVLAVARSLRGAARADMGVSEKAPIPEWTEYTDVPQVGAEKQNGCVTLLASMCAGDQLYAYIAVSPIPEEIAALLASNSPQYEWDLGGSNTKGTSWNVEQTAYEVETQTALVKVSVRGEEIQKLDQVEINLSLTHNLKEERTYGPVAIPVTESQMISCLTDVPVKNTKDSFDAAWGTRPESLNIPDYTLNGSINRIVICAGYIEVELETPGLEQWITASNVEQVEVENPSDTAFDMKEFFVKRIFCGSWQVSVNEALRGAELNHEDGTSVVIEEIPSPYAGVWTIMDSATADLMYGERQVYRFTPQQAFELRTIKSITIGNAVYSFPEFIG